jgi:hypothetical protein
MYDDHRLLYVRGRGGTQGAEPLLLEFPFSSGVYKLLHIKYGPEIIFCLILCCCLFSDSFVVVGRHVKV